MSYQFTLIERMILEELSHQDQTFESLQEVICISRDALFNAINLLLAKGLIKLKDLDYSLNQKIIQKEHQNITQYKNHLFELKELISSAIEYSVEKEDQSFALRKVALSQDDLIILKSHIYNINTLLESAQKNKKGKKTKFVFYWGYGNYQEIVNHSLY